MKESVTYQAIVEEGRADEARRLLLRLGTLRFGATPEQAQTMLMMVPNVEKLEELSDHIFSAESWDELLVGTNCCKVSKGQSS